MLEFKWSEEVQSNSLRILAIPLCNEMNYAHARWFDWWLCLCVPRCCGKLHSFSRSLIIKVVVEGTSLVVNSKRFLVISVYIYNRFFLSFWTKLCYNFGFGVSSFGEVFYQLVEVIWYFGVNSWFHRSWYTRVGSCPRGVAWIC